jgi:hypothetical protein
VNKRELPYRYIFIVILLYMLLALATAYIEDHESANESRWSGTPVPNSITCYRDLAHCNR